MRKITFWLSLILITTIPAEGIVVIPGFGTISRLIGYLAIGTWFASALNSRYLRQFHLFHLAVYLFFLWNGLSYFWSADPESTFFRLLTYFQLFILVVLLWNLYRTPSAIKAGLQAYILGAFFSIGSVIFNFLNGRFLTYVLSSERYSANGFNANDLAVILSLGLPIAWYLATYKQESSIKNRILRIADYAYIPIALITIILTGSRTGTLISLIALIYILSNFSKQKLFSRIIILMAMIGSFFFLVSYVPRSTTDRILGTGADIMAGDLGGREIIWRNAFTVFLEHPLIGIGSSAYKEIAGSIHNTFLGVLVELGIVGLIGFIIIMIIVVRNAWRQPSSDRWFWLTIFLIWAAGVITLNWVYRKPTWLFFSLIVSSSVILRERMDILSKGVNSYFHREARNSMVANSNSYNNTSIKDK